MIITASPTVNLETLELKIRLAVAVIGKTRHDDFRAIHLQSLKIARLSKERRDFLAARCKERVAANKRGLNTTTPDRRRRQLSDWQHGSASAPHRVTQQGLPEAVARAVTPKLPPSARGAGHQKPEDTRTKAPQSIARREPRLGGSHVIAPKPLKRAVTKRTVAFVPSQ